eukprot:TRINITY_DN15193_c1_g1_i4.p1 TRINITY_DN15193_c1_g1~~TRINITY_DN15193_c1_g1_i4.p1  ORF type:complete len:1528 (+),score=301.75 TRINITY_DN15193_c1_g1_i4:80-4663(+)
MASSSNDTLALPTKRRRLNGPAVTVNADMGESFGLWTLGDDEALMAYLHLANVACGFHAGDPSVMATTVMMAKRHGVAVGAHPSFLDLQGFGRREMKLAPGELRDLVTYQVGALLAFLQREGVPLSHVKPHGSLYGVTSRDEQACRELFEALQTFGVPLVGMAGSFHEKLSRDYDVAFIPEFFADLEYDPAGKLIITRSHKSVEPAVAAARVTRALRTGSILANDGKTLVNVSASTVCVHSDTPGAAAVARAVREAVDEFNKASLKQPSLAGGPEKRWTILIANRGEIAVRVMRSCKKLGLRTAAVYTAPDPKAPHVLDADVAREVDSYTSVAGLLEACRACAADAVFPGYGFLSENAAFAKAVEEAGLAWVGPRPDTMEKFGLKHIARELAEAAGVPTVPGSRLLGSAEEAVREAARIGYPTMLKATGGGGGIGMQQCADEAELRAAFEKCGRLAEENFAHGGVYLERYYPKSRHIEVQVFGDGEGHVIHLGERECSIQRRNQKILEETPSPFVERHPDLRAALCSAAVRLAKSVNYRSAGTVEFLVVDDEAAEPTPSGRLYFFLEMNTRLQVEHGITELVTREDIVASMLKLSQAAQPRRVLDDMRWRPVGHAIEVRLYAENPTRDFQPSPGRLTEVSFPDSPHVRVDGWVSAGTAIPPDYDSLLAKLMVYGSTRQDAIDKLQAALADTRIAGPPTNLQYLAAVAKSEKFASGMTTTRFLQSLVFKAPYLDVLQAGPATTVQDYPARIGFRVYGIQSSGPADHLAFRAANIMVGNDEGLAALEFAVRGPKLLFHQGRSVAVTGAAFQITVKRPGEDAAEKQAPWSRFYVPPGSTLTIGSRLKSSAGGNMGYLAVEGGVSVPSYLGSCSTSMVYGGVQGRALKPGDVVPLHGCETQPKQAMALPGNLIPSYTHHWEVMVLAGPHADPYYLTAEDADMFVSTDWQVHHNSGRTGVRLVGPRPTWARSDGGRGGSHPSNIHDCGYALGSINFTGDMPIILTGEGPTQGGFVCPFTIPTLELWKVGQFAAGDKVRFRVITHADALDHMRCVGDYLKTVKIAVSHWPVAVPVPAAALDAVLRDTTPGNRPHRAYRGKCVLKYQEGDAAKAQPPISILQAGERYVLMEYGSPEDALNMNLRARVHVLQTKLGLITDTASGKASPTIPGLCDAAGAMRSILIQYEPTLLPQSTLIEHLLRVDATMPDVTTMKFPAREIHMPIHLNDKWCQAAVDQYKKLVRSEAVYLPSNPDFVAKNNALETGDEACQTLARSKWLVIAVGFYLGCPFAIPFDPRCRLEAPKYNPARTYTPDGAVGIGGPYLAIYPIECPGGYQLFGRTIPTWESFSTRQPFTKAQPWLLNAFDVLVWEPVSEKELVEIREKCAKGQYTYDIRETVFDMADQNQFEESVKEASAALRARQDAAQAAQRKLESDILAKQDAQKLPANGVAAAMVASADIEGLETVETDLAGTVLLLCVKEGDTLVQDETVVCVVEAMKMEVHLKASCSGKVRRLTVASGQQVLAGDVVCAVRP